MKYSEFSKNELIELVKFNKGVINNVPIGFCITNEEGLYESVNEAYCQIYGYSKEELIGEHFSLVTTEANTEELVKLHAEFLATGDELKKEWNVKKKSGEKINISVYAARLKGSDGGVKKVTYVLDITEQKELERKLKKANKKLKEKAIKDDLTSLYNHGETMTRLEAEINRSSHVDSPLTIMMIDVDDFREVNNEFGHIVGDRVLKEMAAKIKDNIRKMDIAGRVGGDEMMVIFPDTTLVEAKIIAERVLNAMRKNKIAGVNVTFSAGLYQYKSENASNLVAKADELMYQAKNRDKNEIVLGSD